MNEPEIVKEVYQKYLEKFKKRVAKEMSRRYHPLSKEKVIKIMLV